MNDLRVLGTVLRSHGLHGSFKVNISASGVPEIQRDEPVFILLQGGPVPFFVEECEQTGSRKLVMKLDGIDDLTQAEKLIGKQLLLERSRFHAPQEDADEQLVGFRVVDKERADIGEITGIMDSPQHPILEVQNGENTILIPYVPEIVLHISIEDSTVHIAAPDGLIDLYTDG